MSADNNQPSDLGRAIADVSDATQFLIREEIALAKAEITQKVSRLITGAVVGIAAGIFAVFGLIYLLHALAWLVAKLLDEDNVWLGYLIVAVALFLLGGLAGFLAARLIKRSAPPTPSMAIEEAQRIKETVKPKETA